MVGGRKRPLFLYMRINAAILVKNPYYLRPYGIILCELKRFSGGPLAWYSYSTRWENTFARMKEAPQLSREFRESLLVIKCLKGDVIEHAFSYDEKEFRKARLLKDIKRVKWTTYA